MDIAIIKRNLRNLEISELVQETKLFPDLLYVSPNHWRRFSNLYCLIINQQFAGVCAVCAYKNWIKIGPIVLLRRYHGKGFGKKLLHFVVQNNKDKNLFITSSNLVVQKIVTSFGFHQMTNFVSMPIRVGIFFAIQSIDYLTVRLLKEGVRKLFSYHRGSRRYFIKKLM